MQKHSFKEQERQRREQEILRVASQLLVERGYANLNMDDLADVVGISKPTLYQHFSSKEELVSQVVMHSYSVMEEQLATELTGTPLEKISRLFRYIAKARYVANSITGTIDQETLWSVMRTNPLLGERRKQAYEGLSSLVDQAKELGEISMEVPTRLVVQAMFSLQGAFKGHGPLNELTNSDDNLEVSIDAMLGIFLHGIVPPDTGQTQKT